MRVEYAVSWVYFDMLVRAMLHLISAIGFRDHVHYILGLPASIHGTQIVAGQNSAQKRSTKKRRAPKWVVHLRPKSQKISGATCKRSSFLVSPNEVVLSHLLF